MLFKFHGPVFVQIMVPHWPHYFLIFIVKQTAKRKRKNPVQKYRLMEKMIQRTLNKNNQTTLNRHTQIHPQNISEK